MGIQSFLSTRSQKQARVRYVGVSSAVARAARSCVETLETRQLLTGTGMLFDTPPVIVTPPADTQVPTATLKTENIKIKAGESVKVVVRYEDKDGSLNLSTLGAGDITVQNQAKGSLTVAFDGVTGDETAPSTYNATYTIQGPGGSWDALEGDSFTFLVNAGAVADSAGNRSEAVTSALKVEVEAPAVPPVVPPTVPRGIL